MERKEKRIHYGWFILLLSFLALLAVQGIRLSFGGFIQPWESEFSTTRGNISLIATVSFLIFGLSQPLAGKLVDHVGAKKVITLSVLLVGISTLLTFFVTSYWQLFILYGFVSSIGFGGASSVVASVAVTNWFQRKRGLAFGLITAGMSAGQLILVPLCLFLIHYFSWHLAVFILGSFLILAVFPLLLLFFKTFPSEKGLQPYGAGGAVSQENHSHHNASQETKIQDNKTQENDTQGENLKDMNVSESQVSSPVLKSSQFWLLAIPFFICGYTTTGLIDTHLIPFSHDHGFSTKVTGTAVSLLAAFNMIGTLLSGYIADHFNNRRYLAILYLSRGLTIVLLIFTEQWLLLFTFAILFGFVDFATVAPTTLLASQYFNKQSLGFVIGLLSLAHQVGSALGAYIPGILYDSMGDYSIALGSAVVLLVLASMLSLALPEPMKHTQSARILKKKEGVSIN